MIDQEAMSIIIDITRDNPFVEGGHYGFVGDVCKYCGARHGETKDGIIAEEHPTSCIYRRAIRVARKQGLIPHAE